ncbi:MAG: hypothetical protein AAF799_28310 [Myxococcota bacterium]
MRIFKRSVFSTAALSSMLAFGCILEEEPIDDDDDGGAATTGSTPNDTDTPATTTGNDDAATDAATDDAATDDGATDDAATDDTATDDTSADDSTGEEASTGEVVCEEYAEVGCYWQENETGLFCWVPAPEGKLSYEECRALDSCTEGGGDESGGGCYKWSEGSEGYFYPWACEFYEGEQCYWEENETGLFCWVPAPEGEVDITTCEALDSCSGGGGKSGGGCYKWAGTSVSVGDPW